MEVTLHHLPLPLPRGTQLSDSERQLLAETLQIEMGLDPSQFCRVNPDGHIFIGYDPGITVYGKEPEITPRLIHDSLRNVLERLLVDHHEIRLPQFNELKVRDVSQEDVAHRIQMYRSTVQKPGWLRCLLAASARSEAKKMRNSEENLARQKILDEREKEHGKLQLAHLMESLHSHEDTLLKHLQMADRDALEQLLRTLHMQQMKRVTLRPHSGSKCRLNGLSAQLKNDGKGITIEAEVETDAVSVTIRVVAGQERSLSYGLEGIHCAVSPDGIAVLTPSFGASIEMTQRDALRVQSSPG